MIKYFHNNKTLSFVLVSTLLFILYITLILSRVSGCFTLEVGSNSLGLSFYYTKDMVQNFFELRTEEQLLCYSDFLKIWDTIFAVVYTFMYASWIAFLLKNKRIFLIIPIFAMICDWVEMKDRLSNWNSFGSSKSNAEAESGTSAMTKDAEIAMINLGYKPQHATRAVAQVLKDNPDLIDGEQLIRLALKSMV